MAKLRESSYEKSRRRARKVNYDIEKRRRKIERKRRKKKRKEDTSFKERLQALKKYFPLVGKWVLKIALVCFLAFVFVWFFGQKVSVVGDSMKPVLENEDMVLVDTIRYDAISPKRGDVIVFKPKGNKSSHYYIKRIVGLPGETVEIVENSIFIDGEKLEEDYETTDISDAGIVTEKIKLGSDEYFVLGDDRQNSSDSRDAEVGNVKRSYIYGKAWFVTSPASHIGFVR